MTPSRHERLGSYPMPTEQPASFATATTASTSDNAEPGQGPGNRA